jgi:AcrR family transcriptional regulator
MPSRPYSSTVREDGAVRTRLAVLDAAEALFAEQGYGRTKLPEIAASARVAVNTVYSSVGGKKELVHAIVDRYVDHEVVRNSLVDIEAARSVDDLIRLLVAGVRRSYEITLRPALVVIDAVRDDGGLEDAYRTMTEPYLDRLQRLADRCSELHEGAGALESQAVSQAFWFFLGYSAWKTMQDFGWSWDARETWTARRLAETIADLAQQDPA